MTVFQLSQISVGVRDEFPESEFENALAFYADYYGKHLLDNTVAYPGVKEALEALGKRKLAVLSNKDTGFSHDVLDGLGLGSYFFAVCGAGKHTVCRFFRPFGAASILAF